MADLESFTVRILPKPSLRKDEYIPVSEITARIQARSKDAAEHIAKAWCEQHLPYHYLDSII